jgi:DNA-binding transcriptional MocR family regulator
MTISPQDLATHAGPRYRALADALARAVGEGRLRPGARLPTQRELAEQLGVTVGTVGRAYALAEQRGLISCEVGRGSFVRDSTGPVHSLTGIDSLAEDGVDLRLNAPSPTAIDAELMAEIAALAASPSSMDLLRGYAPGTGLMAHREAAACWLAECGIQAEPERIVMTGGAQAGLYLTLAVLTQPGDTLLVEQLCYAGARDIALRLRLRLEGVAMDEHGIRPDSLAEAATATGARLALVTPSLHNPTTIQMPESRRAELIRASSAAGLRLIEDDIYGPLVDPAPTTLAVLAPESVVHVGSISKGILPGLRVGFVLAPRDVVAPLGQAMHAQRVNESPFGCGIFARWLERGLLRRALMAQRLEATARQRLARELLTDLDLVSPSCGLHGWLRLPGGWEPAEAERRLAERGVHVAPASLFWSGRGAPPRALRLALGRPATRAQLAGALRIIAETLTGSRANPNPVL